MALMRLLFSLSELSILFEVLDLRDWIMEFLSLQSLLSCLFSAFISDIFVMCVSSLFWSTRIVLPMSDIYIENKGSGRGGGVRE